MPLTEEDEQRLQKYEALKISANSHAFSTANRCDEVKLRARKRQKMCGPEDALAEKIGKSAKDGPTAKIRWNKYLAASRTMDGAPLEPEPRSIAKPVKGAKAKATTEWLNPSSRARFVEVLFLEECKKSVGRLFETNTRPQVDAGTTPVQDSAVGRTIGIQSLLEEPYTHYCDRTFELPGTPYSQYTDAIVLNFDDDDITAPNTPPDDNSFMAAYDVSCLALALAVLCSAFCVL